MVERMKYVSITGPTDRMDHVIERYFTRYDIQLENAAKQIHYDDNLQPFTGANPYVGNQHKAASLLKLLGAAPTTRYPMTGEEAVRRVEEAYEIYEKRDVTLKSLERQREAIQQYVDQLSCFTSLDIPLDRLESFAHISYNFGRMPVHNFRQFETFLYDDSEILFIKSHSDNDYLWGVYFTPMSARNKINSIFSSLHFERISISSRLLDEQRSGTPAAIVQYWRERLNELETQIKKFTDSILDGIPGTNNELATACERIHELYDMFDIRKFAAVSRNGDYLFMGWMTQKDALAFEEEASKDDLTFFSRYGETGEHPFSDNPPTRMKNPPIIRFFEFFTRMYGLPAYGEIDPTPILAVTYTLLFGLMFGDLGQGLVIALLGFFFYKRFKSDFGGIITVAGLSGAVFGLMYGSVFGFEDILPALWRRPAEDINGTLFFAIGLGVGIIFLSMLLHIANAIKQKHWSELFFNPNGITGMMFYGMVLIQVLRVVMYGHVISGLDIALVCLPLVFVAFREPLIRFIEGKPLIIEGGIVMFFFSTILEMVEVLLSYATNTISFVRVGAFAISHTGMMSVVLLLARSASGTNNPVVIVFGNLLVMGIEGLLVGIQVLRLDFYEIFSRFYNGGGSPFETYHPRNKAVILK